MKLTNFIDYILDENDNRSVEEYYESVDSNPNIVEPKFAFRFDNKKLTYIETEDGIPVVLYHRDGIGRIYRGIEAIEMLKTIYNHGSSLEEIKTDYPNWMNYACRRFYQCGGFGADAMRFIEHLFHARDVRIEYKKGLLNSVKIHIYYQIDDGEQSVDTFRLWVQNINPLHIRINHIATDGVMVSDEDLEISSVVDGKLFDEILGCTLFEVSAQATVRQAIALEEHAVLACLNQNK